MKKLLFLSVAISLALSSCSRNEEDIAEDIAQVSIGEITITTPEAGQKIGVGQLVTANVNVLSDTTKLKYSWSDDYGYQWNNKELNWFPSKTGIQKIRVSVSNGVSTKSVEKQVEVSNCDYRLCFWGQSVSDMLLNEVAYHSYYYKKLIDPKISSDFYIFQDVNDPSIAHGYRFNSDLNITGGVDLFIKDHNISGDNLEDYNVYINDYNTIKQELTTKYGQPTSDEITYLYDYTDRSPKYLGYNVVFGSTKMKTVFETDRTTIVMEAKLAKKYGALNMTVVYLKK